MIITNDILNNKPPKFKAFKDTTCFINFVNTEDELGVVCYFYEDANVWQPFSTSECKKHKFKAKSYSDLIVDLPKLDSNDISEARGKFYNTFDTPIEVNPKPFYTSYSVIEQGKNKIFERKTYYLITDVQELERTFNSNIMPCEIINFNAINDLFKGKPVDENLKFVIENILK